MDEARRLAALDRYAILDTPADPAFDALTRATARALDVPIALVSFVDANRQWFKACVGLTIRETSRDVSFCAHAILSDEVMVVRDATTDPRFANNPFVVGDGHLRSYAGAPLVAPNGARLGTLCAIDREPRDYTADEMATLRDLAMVVVEMLERRLAAREQQILGQIANVSPDGAFVYDVQKDRLVWSNPHMAQLFRGLRDWRRIIHPEDLPRLDRYMFDDDGIEAIPVRMLAHGGKPARSVLVRRTVFERDACGKVRSIVGVVTDVTAIQLADERLRASERALADRVLVLEGILESVGEGILFSDASGQLRLANTKARELRNHTTSVTPDATFMAEAGIYDESGTIPLSPAQLPLVRALGGEVVDMQRMFVRNPHVPLGVHIQARARPIVDADGSLRGAVATLVDVTALQIARDQLSRSLANVSSITDAIPIGLFVRRGDRMIYANPAFAQLLGWERAELVGIEILEIVDPADRSLVAHRMAHLDGNSTLPPPPLAVIRLQARHGVVTVEATSLRVDYDGEPAVLVICRDVTHEQQARAQIDASLREKEALLKEIHHRVKNNLSVIASLLFMQSRSSTDPVMRDALAQSMARVRSIGLVHEQLYSTKDLAHIELGGYLRTLVRETLSTLAGAERGVAFEVRADPISIDLDQAMPCGLIVNELLTNAIKHAFPPGGGGGTVVIGVHEELGRVHIEVTDNGVGFDPTAVRPGSLGLELIRELCAQLDARSTMSGSAGTSFAFSFERRQR